MKPPQFLITAESPRQIIFDDFKIDLPIKGGWGYDLSTACVIDKNDPSVDRVMPFDGLGVERVFVEKRIYEEYIIFRPVDEQFAGIRWNLVTQRLLEVEGLHYDQLSFEVTAFEAALFDEISNRFQDISRTQRWDLLPALDEYREANAYRFEAEYFFEISSFFGQGA